MRVGVGWACKIHPKLCGSFLVRLVFMWRCCWPREEMHSLQEYLLKKQWLALSCAGVPDVPLLSVSCPGVVQEPVSERELVLLHRAFPCKVPDVALGLTELHQISVSLFLPVPLSDSPAIKHIDTSSQFGLIWKYGKSALGCFFQVSNEDRSQDSPLWYSTCCQPPGRVFITIW